MSNAKTIIIALVGAAVVAFLVAAFIVGNSGNVSGVNTNPDTYANGLGIGGWKLFNVLKLEVPLGTDQIYWTNKTGRTLYVPAALAILKTTGTASSTQAISVYASTTTAFPNSHDFTVLAPASNFSIFSTLVPTSTAATTTDAAHDFGITATGMTFGTDGGLVKIADGTSIILGVQAVCATRVCEYATSTLRGYNPIAYIPLIELK